MLVSSPGFRLLGLTGIVKTDCDNPNSFIFHDEIKWWVILNPGVLLFLYWMLAFNTPKQLSEKLVGI